MDMLKTLFSSHVSNLPVRPLLFVAGAAATAAGAHYYFTKPKRTADTNRPKDPAVDAIQIDGAIPKVMVSGDRLDDKKPDLASQRRNNTTATNNYEAHNKLLSEYNEMKEQNKILMAALSEARVAHEQALRVNAQLEEEKSELKYHVHKLTGTVKQLEETLYEADVTRGVIKQDCERAGEAYSSLMNQHQEIIKQRDELLKEREQNQEDYSILCSQIDKIRKTYEDTEKSLMVTLSEATLAHERALRVNAQLEDENSDLKYHVHKLTGTVKQLEQMMYEADITCGVVKQDRERAGEAYSSLMKQHQKIMKEHDELLKESEQKQEAYGILCSQFDKIKETVEDAEKSLIVTLSEATEAHELPPESNVQADNKSDLMYQAVKQLKHMLQEADKACGVIKQDHEHPLKAYCSLMEQLNETIKQRDELLKEKEKEQEAHRSLKAQYNDQQQRIKLCDMLLGKLQRA